MENELIKWCREEIAMMQKTMKLMIDGTLKTISYENTTGSNKQVDKTQDWIAEYERRIADLESITARSGKK